MSTQQDAAAVVLEGISLLHANTTSANKFVRQATLDNVAHLGPAIDWSMYSTAIAFTAWTYAFNSLDKTFFNDDDAGKVTAEYSKFTQVYIDLMLGLIDKHSVLVSENSPLPPDGASIRKRIDELQNVVKTLPSQWLPSFVGGEALLNEVKEQGKRAREAYDLTFTQYPKADGPDDKDFSPAVGRINLPPVVLRK